MYIKPVINQPYTKPQYVLRFRLWFVSDSLSECVWTWRNSHESHRNELVFSQHTVVYSSNYSYESLLPTVVFIHILAMLLTILIFIHRQEQGIIDKNTNFIHKLIVCIFFELTALKCVNRCKNQIRNEFQTVNFNLSLIIIIISKLA